MANTSILSQSSGSNKAGNPIVISLRSSDEVPSSASFHTLKININVCAFNASFGSGVDYAFSTPVSNGENVSIDVSSAIRAFFDSYSYSPTDLTFPTAKFRISAHDEYMRDSQVFVTSTVTRDESGPFSLGSYYGIERLRATTGFKNATLGTDDGKYSRKPTSSPEIVYLGDTFVYPSSASSSASVSLSNSDPNNPTYKGLKTVGGRSIYVVTRNIPDHYQLRFVNSLGTIESISLFSARKSEVSITSTQYHRTVKSSAFNATNGSFYTKKNDYETWSLSTGPITEDWKIWFAHELLMTSNAWILIGSTWVPVHTVPEDTVELIDTTSQKPFSITIPFRFDLTGPIK